jgi:hypothetical protein
MPQVGATLSTSARRYSTAAPEHLEWPLGQPRCYTGPLQGTDAPKTSRSGRHLHLEHDRHQFPLRYVQVWTPEALLDHDTEGHEKPLGSV